MVLSDGTTSSLLELFAELNPDKKVELSRFVNGKIDFSYRFCTCEVWITAFSFSMRNQYNLLPAVTHIAA